MSWEHIATLGVKDDENLPARSDPRMKRHRKEGRVVKVTRT